MGEAQKESGGDRRRNREIVIDRLTVSSEGAVEGEMTPRIARLLCWVVGGDSRVKAKSEEKVNSSRPRAEKVRIGIRVCDLSHH